MGAGADIIDRIDEQQYLLRFLRSNPDEKKTLILRAPSGFGKSYITDRVVSQLPDPVQYAIVGRATKYDGATYIQQIAGALNDCAKKAGKFLTISQFRDLLRSEDVDPSLTFLEQAVEPAGKIVTGAITPGTLGKAFKALGGFLSLFAASDPPEDEIIGSKNSDAIKFCERYARYVIGRSNVILRINGYDDIGGESDFYLRSLYGNARRLTLILEVTARPGSPDGIATRISISDHFSGGSVDYREIDKVAVEHVVAFYEQALPRGQIDVSAVVRDAFLSAGGNFRRFDFLLEEKIRRPLFEDDASSEDRLLTLVNALPVNGKRLLALMLVTPARLSSESLHDIWSDNNWSAVGDLGSTLSRLYADFGSLISSDARGLALTAEFMRDYLLRCLPLEIFRIEARRVLLAQLRRENLSSRSRDKVYANLLSVISLSIQGGGSGDASLLPSALRDLDLGRYPSNKIELAKDLKALFFEYVRKGRPAATDPGSLREYDKVYEEICKALYRIGDLDALEEITEAYFPLLPLDKHNDLLRLTIISAKILNCRKDALADLEAIDRGARNLYVGSRLLLILYYRTFGFLRRAKREWRHLRDSGEIRKTPFEGLLYEYGALTHPINIFGRFHCLRKAKAHHLAAKNDFHAVACSLGIASTYLYIPWLRRLTLAVARKELGTVEPMLPRVRIMDHILENFTAVAELLVGEKQSAVLEKLMFAYDRCALRADKLLIGANLIECFIRLRLREPDIPSIAAYVKDVLSIGRVFQNRNSEFALYALSACYRYFRFMDDRQMSREIRKTDLGNMPIHLSFYNLGRPRTVFGKLFVRWIYSDLYVWIWPRVQPVFNWSIDFYSFQ